MTGLECDTMDEIEGLVDRFDCDEMQGRRESSGEAKAERAFEDLYMVSGGIALYCLDPEPWIIGCKK